MDPGYSTERPGDEVKEENCEPKEKVEVEREREKRGHASVFLNMVGKPPKVLLGSPSPAGSIDAMSNVVRARVHPDHAIILRNSSNK